MGKELAITVTDIMQMDTTYCHVKTTPSMPIRKAVRMSISLPGKSNNEMKPTFFVGLVNVVYFMDKTAECSRPYRKHAVVLL